MRISINLATRPFIELRPRFARLRLAMVALVVVAVALGFWLHALNGRAKVAQAQMNALKAKTQQFQQERQANEARMRQPQNMAVLERSQFLNELFANKSFSWTAVMMDLERDYEGRRSQYPAACERRARSGGAVGEESGDIAAIRGSTAGQRGGREAAGRQPEWDAGNAARSGGVRHSERI